MIEMHADSLVFTFPEVHPGAKLTIDFQRTLRIPDDGRDWPLPPGMGRFPLRHVDDFGDRVPPAWVEHGGLMLPMYQAEAMWLSFSSESLDDHDACWPFTVKIATGKRSAVTGEAWTPGLSQDPQDYLVIPEQPWLDGYVVEKGLIRQFVAMPLGRGYTAEEQLTGEGSVGGLQIEVRPMRREAFLARWPKLDPQRRWNPSENDPCDDVLMCCCMPMGEPMGLAPGGKMRQEVYEDPFDYAEWDLETKARCFVHITNSVDWRHITGSAPPSPPPTARDYSERGLPWFDYYDGDAQALKGAKPLAKLKSVAQMAKTLKDPAVGDGGTVDQVKVVLLGKKRNRHEVREGEF